MVTANILTALLAVHVFLNSKSVLLFVKLNHTAYKKKAPKIGSGVLKRPQLNPGLVK